MSNRINYGQEPTKTAAAPTIDAEVVSGAPVANAPAPVVIDAAPAAAIPTGPAGNPNVPAVIPQTDSAVATRSAGGYDDEDISFEDIILPALNIVQGIGDLSKIFNAGEITLNQSLVVHVPPNVPKGIAGTKPLNLTVIGFRKKKYVEDVKFGEPFKVFKTEAEVVAAGGTLDYAEARSRGLKLYQRLATGLFLVQKPEHIQDEDHLVFSHECEGKYYSLALWSMKKTAYTGGAKIIYTARKQGHLKSGGYPSFNWNLTTKLKAFDGNNSAQVPVLTPGTRNTPEFMAFVQRVLTSGD